MIHDKVDKSLPTRLISSLILGKWISRVEWELTCNIQSNKGLKKYGHTIDECPIDRFNWKIMAIEELVDFWVYKKKMQIKK